MNAEFTESVKELVVDGTGVVEKCPYYTLDAFDSCVVKLSTCVFFWRVLDFGAVLDWRCLPWGKNLFLGAGMIVFKTVRGQIPDF